jgi:hypothetical protein
MKLFSISTSTLALIFLSAIGNSVAQFDGFGGAGPKHCPPYNKCAKDEEPVPKWPMKLVSTGCNKLGGGLSMSSTGAFDEGVTAVCCDQWNACNQICGSTRTYCDSTFEKCLETKCAEITDAEERKLCTANSGTKKLLLSFSDCSSFEEGQNSGCECVKKSKVGEKRKRILTNFYKKYNPKESDKAEKLASKATDPKKFAGLLLKLAVKYPKSVKRMKDPQQKMMEDLLKKHEDGGSDSAPPKAETVTEEKDPSEEENSDEERIEL